MRRISAFVLTTTALAVTGCTWVHMAPGASAVRVIPAGAAPANCDVRGDIAVSVKGKVGFYERNPLRVREELETLARNEGPGLQADTIQPLDEPHDGEQAVRRLSLPQVRPSRGRAGAILPAPPASYTRPAPESSGRAASARMRPFRSG